MFLPCLKIKAGNNIQIHPVSIQVDQRFPPWNGHNLKVSWLPILGTHVSLVSPQPKKNCPRKIWRFWGHGEAVTRSKGLDFHQTSSAGCSGIRSHLRWELFRTQEDRYGSLAENHFAEFKEDFCSQFSGWEKLRMSQLGFVAVCLRSPLWWNKANWKSISTKCLAWKISLPVWSLERRIVIGVGASTKLSMHQPFFFSRRIEVQWFWSDRFSVIFGDWRSQFQCPFPCPVSEVKAFNQSLSGHSTGKVALQIFGNASEILVWALHLAGLGKSLASSHTTHGLNTHIRCMCRDVGSRWEANLFSAIDHPSNFDSVAVTAVTSTSESLQLDPGRESKAAVLLRKRFSCIEAVALR